MKIEVKYLLPILLFACSPCLNGNNQLKQGLHFYSFEVDKDKRTCLELTPDKPLVFKDGFSLEFALNLRHYNQNFGYIFRIIGNDTLNIDFLVNLDSETANFCLVIKNRIVIQYMSSEIGDVIENTWINPQVAINPQNKTISLSLNGIKKEAEYPYKNITQFEMYFGGNMHSLFSTTDIAPMTIKDIRIYDDAPRLIRHWKLGDHSGDAAYDECESAKAVALYPQWEIDSHSSWEKRMSVVLPGSFYGIAFDPVKNRFFIAKNEKFYIYDAKSQAMDTIDVRRGIPYNTEFNQLIYNSTADKLVSYQFRSNRLTTFDFNTSEWDNKDATLELPHFSHHSRLFMADDSLLVTFGGYGYHRYRSILHTYDLAAESWQTNDLSGNIIPRYLGSMGLEGRNNILYFGGFGNESGRQEESPRNYYDLYRIDIEKMEAEKIWELPNPVEHYTNSNSLIIDSGNRKFYALSYPNQRYASEISLHEYDLDEPEYRIVGNSIPYYFNDVDSYCDLYLSSDSTELYALTSYVKNDATEIHIYSIAFPPLSIREVEQHTSSHPTIRTWTVFILLLIVSCSAVIVYLKKRVRKSAAGVHPVSSDEEEENSMLYERIFEQKSPSSISLLGNFQVVDTLGNDITKDFTPTTTQLFLLLLLSTIKNGQGITSQELRKILWYDKSDEKARNNRNVYINKLRSILKPLEGFRIMVNEGNWWSVQSEKEIFCDYERAMILLRMSQTGSRFSTKSLTELVDIALKGTLLPYIQQTEWLESYLSDFSNQLIGCLMEYSKRDDVRSDLLLLLKIADAVQLHDNIDEDAIRLKCYALFQLGRKNQALQAFHKFTSDYEYLLATKHNLVFEELIV